MPAIVSMLRGVNVGPHKRIKMDTLRALYQSLKLRDPQTYIQSGNVVFCTGECDLALLTTRIENAIERKFGFRVAIMLRTISELQAVVARNPFADRPGVEPGKLLITFLASHPAPEARAQVLKMKTDPEELFLEGRELYIYFPNGMGRSKLSMATLERVLRTPGTARNWNSVTKLLEMAERMEGAS